MPADAAALIEIPFETDETQRVVLNFPAEGWVLMGHLAVPLSVSGSPTRKSAKLAT